MRTITAQPGFTVEEVEAVMDSGQFIYTDCFTIIPKVGSPLRYTNQQRDVSVVPVGELVRQTYLGNVVLIKGLRVKTSLGTEVDEQQIDLSYPDTEVYQAALTWAQALLQGRLDGALVRRDRYIAEDYGRGPGSSTRWMGGFPMFLGLVSTLNTVGRQSAVLSVKSNLVLLNRQAPAHLWEPNCKNTWGDPACGVNQGAWAVAGTVGVGSTRNFLAWSSASTDYNLGKVHIENSDSVTRVRTVARATSSGLYLAYPLDFDPMVGLEFMAYPGCSRTNDPTTGCPKYWGVDWKDHFAGYPFIPVAETAV